MYICDKKNDASKYKFLLVCSNIILSRKFLKKFHTLLLLSLVISDAKKAFNSNPPLNIFT